MSSYNNGSLYILDWFSNDGAKDGSKIWFLSKYESAILNYFTGNNSLWSDFLSESRAGSAQKLRGQPVKLFLESISLSVATFFVQLVIFNIVKEAIPEVYQPNTLLSNLQQKISRFSFKLTFSTNGDIRKDEGLAGATGIIDSVSTFKAKLWKIGFNFKWIFLLLLESTENFESFPLDSFYILRFLAVLQQFFAILSLAITPCLAFIHLRASNKSYNQNIIGLDKISIYSLQVSDSDVLIVHLVFTVFAVFLFHWFLLKELEFFVSKKLNFIKQIQKHNTLNSDKFTSKTEDSTNSFYVKNKSDSLFIEKMCKEQSTVLVQNLPGWSYSQILEIFNKLAPKTETNAVSKIWYVPKEIGKLESYCKKHNQNLKRVEKNILHYALSKIYLEHESDINLYFTENCRWAKQSNNSIKALEYQTKQLKFKRNCFCFKVKTKVESIKVVFLLRKTKINLIKYDFYFLLPIISFSNRFDYEQESIDNEIKLYFKNFEDWLESKRSIQKQYLNNQLAKNNEKSEIKHVIIKFKNIYIADIFCQLLLVSAPCNVVRLKRNINFNGMNWSNINFDNKYLLFLSHCIISFSKTVIIICWAVPVALLGLILQIPYLTICVPILNLIYKCPESIVSLINSFLPILTLMIITDLIPEIFRWLIKFKFYSSFEKVELNLQKWFFVFLFVQIFIVISVSSSISVVVEQIITNPINIPHFLVANFPQSSNFFVSFIFIRGLAYCIGNLFQWARLTKWVFVNKLSFSNPKKTPRALFEDITLHSLIYKWGSIYPIFTLMGSIGLIYGIIQPLILPTVTIAVSLALISFKFTIRYQVNRSNNKWETLGKFYPAALFQLYSGIYCLQGLMIGVFVLANKYNLCFFMFTMLVSTVVAHSHIFKKYHVLLYFLPLSDYESEPMLKNKDVSNPNSEVNMDISIPGDLNWKNFNQTMELLPVADPDEINSVIWIPDDDFSISNKEIDRLRLKFGSQCHITNTHAKIDPVGIVQLY